jgi:hypothetical protein
MFDSKKKTFRLNNYFLVNKIYMTDYLKIQTYIVFYLNNLRIGDLIYPITGSSSVDLLKF